MDIRDLQNWIEENCFNVKNKFNAVPLKKTHKLYSQVLDLTSFLNDDVKISQRCWHILNESFEIPKCQQCGVELNFKRFNKGYGMFCSIKCLTKSDYKNKKTKKTKLKRYGDENYNNVEKNRKTCLERYGVESILKLKWIHDLATIASCSDESKEKIKETKRNWSDEKKKEIRSKSEKTCLENYGVKYYFQTDEFKQHMKKFSLENYGVECHLQSPHIKKKIKETTFKNYGVCNPGQTPTVFERSKYKKSWHTYILPSGKEIKLQGYEPKVMDILLASYNEDEILFKRSKVPEVWYLKSETNTWHRYFCDFYIPKDNLIVEVKSKYIYEKYLITNLDKQDACLQLGYNYRLIIL